MNPVPTLADILGTVSSGGEVLRLLRSDLSPGEIGSYLHFNELPIHSEFDRARVWARMKLWRAGARVDLPGSLGSLSLSLCMPPRVQELVFSIMAPLEEGLSLTREMERCQDRSEAEIADALAICRLGGVKLLPGEGANLLRTGHVARTTEEARLLDTYRSLSLSPGVGAQVAGLHPVVGAGVRVILHLEDRARGLLEWRQGLRRASVPGIECFSPSAHLAEDALEHALECMASDEGDATYPLLVLLTAVRDARQGWLAGCRARAGRRAGLGTGSEMNVRQALVLDQVEITPGFATSLAHHKRTFDVVYETARTDLQELAGRGHLTMTRRGRAFVFTAGTGHPEPAMPGGPASPPSPPPEDSLPVFF